MNFPKSRHELVPVLVKIEHHLCAYQNPGRCDCKYGGQNVGKSTEEGPGCPEAAAAAAIIEAMTETEYTRITKRASKMQAAAYKATLKHKKNESLVLCEFCERRKTNKFVSLYGYKHAACSYCRKSKLLTKVSYPL